MDSTNTPKPKQPRAIFDRKALSTHLAALDPALGLAQPEGRGHVLALFKAALEAGRAEVQRRFEKGEADAPETHVAGAYLLDQTVRTLHEFAVGTVFASTTAGTMAMIATGGYGRAEIAPHSDIDLMFLFKAKPPASAEKVVEWMLYVLWDTGLKVGHATRSISEAIKLAKSDHTIRTSLLDARLVSGSEDLFTTFSDRLEKELLGKNQAEFVKAKLEERDRRHERMGDTRYVLEPNIKDGKGGLRDLQTLFWIAKAIYRVKNMAELMKLGVFEKNDGQRFMKARDFLWSVRTHLHYVAGRPEETLSFNVQGELAKRMGYRNSSSTTGVERFMKHYFLVAKDVGDLTRVLCAVLEEQHAKKSRPALPSFPFRKNKTPGFKMDGGRLSVESEEVFIKEPINLLRLFSVADEQEVDIHPVAMRMVHANLKRVDKRLRSNAEANQLFLDMLTSRKDPERVLKWLNEAGVFGRFVPAFGRVVAQMQYDMYHVYTVDEHTIQALGILSRIERDLLGEDHPLSTKVVKKVKSRRVLYMAVLLHDIAKGRGGDHSVLGAEIALKVCRRFGLDEWETETVAWLVLHHLDMSRTAFKRDVEDPQTIKDFIAKVQTPERLKLLLVLTVADIRAVGPAVWNGWKAALLRELYYNTKSMMSGSAPGKRPEARAGEIQLQLSDRLLEDPANWSRADIDHHLALGNMEYWLGVDLDTLVRHANLIKKAEAKDREKERSTGLHLSARSLPAIDVTEVVAYAPDHPGLFSRIAGAMSLAGASIVDARIVTLANGMALDSFWVQDLDGHAFTGTDRTRRLKAHISDALTGRMNPKTELSKEHQRRAGSRTRVFTVPPRVLVDNAASRTATVIEVVGRNRLGFLHDITHALTEMGLKITSAHITTYGERAVDVFYVKDVFGLKVDQDSKIAAIERAVLDAITDNDKELGEGTVGEAKAKPKKKTVNTNK